MCIIEQNQIKDLDFQAIEKWIQSDDFKTELRNVSEEEEAAASQIQEMICIDPEELKTPFHHYEAIWC